MTTPQLLELAATHRWPMLAALAIGLVVRSLKSGRLTLPWTVPARWRPVLALALGIASAAAEAIVAGTPWRQALIGGVVSAAIAALGHGVLVESARNGRELGVHPHDQPPRPRSTSPTTPEG